MNTIEAYEADMPRGIDLFCGQTQFYPNIEKYLKKQYAVSKKSLKGMSLESKVEYACIVQVQDPYRGGVYTAFKKLLYKRNDFAVYARKCAEECLTRKQTISEKSMLCFLLALCEQNSSEASAQLAEICRGTSKNKEPYMTPFDRMLSLQAIGMYNFAVYIEPDFAKKIDLPNNQNFCRSFISWQLQHRDYTGKPFIHYEAPLEFYNTVLTTIPPAITLCEDNDKPFKCMSVDAKKFRAELIQKLLERCKE